MEQHLNELTGKLRKFYHEIYQPLTTIILLSDLGTNMGEGLDSDECREIYEAALKCREMLANIHGLMQKYENQLQNNSNGLIDFNNKMPRNF
jgi:hypothetical protein